MRALPPPATLEYHIDENKNATLTGNESLISSRRTVMNLIRKFNLGRSLRIAACFTGAVYLIIVENEAENRYDLYNNWYRFNGDKAPERLPNPMTLHENIADIKKLMSITDSMDVMPEYKVKTTHTFPFYYMSYNPRTGRLFEINDNVILPSEIMERFPKQVFHRILDLW